MKPTQQQIEILDAIREFENIKINAFAGTGKTTTLKLISDSFPKIKILYLAFNTGIKNEAISIFPQNTTIKTTHGLAYAAIKKHSHIDLSKLINYRAIDISKRFRINYSKAIAALKIFENFCNNTARSIKDEDIEHKTAKDMFDQMSENKLTPSHSFYLKYFYLLISEDNIPQTKYDIIMLDEAQDTNGVTLGIFKYLKAKTRIYVGDKHQQIYSFRGSQNSLDKIDVDKELYLSYSFRFNGYIASYANILLKNFKNEKIKIDTITQPNKDIETNAYISRTNSSLISIIANRIKDRKPFVTIRDPNEIFNLTIDLYYCLNNERDLIKRNKFLKEFIDEDEIANYASEVDDFELKTALKIIKEHKDKIFEFKEIADKFYLAWQNRARNGFEQRIKEILFLTTAHTSKGLEWDKITISDDYNDFADLIVDAQCNSLKEFQINQKDIYFANQELIDEFNLFYVAITRAKKEIIKDSSNFHYLMSDDIEKLINQRIEEAKEDIEQLELVKSTKRKKATKIQQDDKQLLRQNRNQKEGRAKNSGLKWSLEDKIKVKSMFKNNIDIEEIANTLERTTGAILGELVKSEVITSAEQIKLTQEIKNRKN
ncbi:MAG: UvrD-helicase domain-containing protein [Campylobacterota bacterium]|nr:UvrD-helicase domain-containing protein [Campylobacterota bacterium]